MYKSYRQKLGKCYVSIFICCLTQYAHVSTDGNRWRLVYSFFAKGPLFVPTLTCKTSIESHTHILPCLVIALQSARANTSSNNTEMRNCCENVESHACINELGVQEVSI